MSIIYQKADKNGKIQFPKQNLEAIDVEGTPSRLTPPIPPKMGFQMPQEQEASEPIVPQAPEEPQREVASSPSDLGTFLAGATPLLVGFLSDGMSGVGDALPISGQTYLKEYERGIAKGVDNRKKEMDLKIAEAKLRREEAKAKGAAGELKDSEISNVLGPDGKPLIQKNRDAIGMQPFFPSKKGEDLDMYKAKKEIDYGFKEKLAKLKGEEPIKPEKKADMENDLFRLRENNAITRSTRKVVAAHDRILDIPDSPTPVDALQAVYELFKVMDDASAVKEGEVALGLSANSKIELLDNIQKRYLDGVKVLPNQLKQIKALARRVYETQKSIQDDFDNSLLYKAEKSGLDKKASVAPIVSHASKSTPIDKAVATAPQASKREIEKAKIKGDGLFEYQGRRFYFPLDSVKELPAEAKRIK